MAVETQNIFTFALQGKESIEPMEDNYVQSCSLNQYSYTCIISGPRNYVSYYVSRAVEQIYGWSKYDTENVAPSI